MRPWMGVRFGAGARVEGGLTLVELRLPNCGDKRELRTEGRLWVTIRFRDRFDIEGARDLGTDRLMLGDGLRGAIELRLLRVGMDRCRVRGAIELRLLRVGMDRCGVGRVIDRDGVRLGVGADLVTCLLLCRLA